MNPSRPLNREMVEELQREQPSALVELVMRMLEPLVQYLEELPVLRAQVTKLKTYQGRCARCGKTVRSTHPRQMSVAAGAAAVQLGARAVAAAAQLKHAIGLTLRKSCRVLELLCGLRTTAGGLAQAFQRASQKLQADDQQLGREMAASPVVHTDETSWWVAGPQSLWVFAREGKNPATLYRVVAHRDRSTFHETIPADFAGVLV